MKRLLMLAALCTSCATTAPQHSSTPETDIAAARALFDQNIAAIQAKDKDAYLACYLADKSLIRAGPEGVKLGFEDLASNTSSVAGEWPTKLEAHDIALHPVAPGVVYGAYRYVVTIEGETTEGISERVFVNGANGWRIAVTTAFAAPQDTR